MTKPSPKSVRWALEVAKIGPTSEDQRRRVLRVLHAASDGLELSQSARAQITLHITRMEALKVSRGHITLAEAIKIARRGAKTRGERLAAARALDRHEESVRSRMAALKYRLVYGDR